MCKKDYSLWISHVGIDVGKAFSRSRVHFSKNWIHISREIPQFTFHIPLIENCTWTSLTSHFSNHISYYIMYIFCFISCILLFMICEMGNGKWDSHFTFLRCQMWFVKQTWNVISIFRKMDSCSKVRPAGRSCCLLKFVRHSDIQSYVTSVVAR